MQATDLERNVARITVRSPSTNFDCEVSVGSVPAAVAKIVSCHFNQRPRGLILHRVHRCKVQPFLVANEVAVVTDIEKVSTHRSPLFRRELSSVSLSPETAKSDDDPI
jgi:hypothetical protein